ncbi:MAG: prephenate dehydrogenase [Gemmatimonadetes bacterium]|nr:prephenate dehydrogenase [Gemmatimonadota bacterium]NNM05984.1 prephenate dehydrogenase [Gemmatimonadota bacterium]
MTSAPFPFSRIGIVGLGLMGGSLARSLRTLPDPPSVVGLSKEPHDIERAMRMGIIAEGESKPESFFSGLDLVVYCTPLNTTLVLLEEHRDRLDPGTVITDVVSLKGPVMEKAKELGLQRRFVGSHPLCGGEGTGLDASREGLFTGSTVWVVAGEAEPATVEVIRGFWRALGAEGVSTQAEGHDALMAVVSHLPQLAANALALALEEKDVSRDDLGPGGKDMTRLAGSSPEMWMDLLAHSPSDLRDGLASLERWLAEIRGLVEEGRGEELQRLMARTQDWFKRTRWN